MAFNSDDIFAKEGEQMVEKHYLARGFNTENVREQTEFQRKDIDLIISDTDSNSFTIEVKRDRKIAGTGNFFIEIISNREEGKEGWFTKCKADYLYYINSETNMAYIFNPQELRKVVDSHITRFTRKVVNDNCKSILGYVIPVDSLRNLILNENGFWKEVQLEELTREDIRFFLRKEWGLI